MKSKSYFVDRIIKLRGEGNRDELMKLQMVDLLQMLNEERSKNKKPETDDIADMIPKEVEEDEEPEAEVEAEEDSDEESIVSIVKRFLFTPPKGE